MADSVDALSEDGTSDELVDPYCDPCFKDGIIRQVAGYCPKCVEFYCQSCLGTHRRSSMTERHKLLLGSDMPSCQADKPVKYQLCDKHDGEGKDRYCFDHGIVICGICFVREHKKCQVKHASDACKHFNMSAEEKSFSYDVGLLLNYVDAINQSMKTNVKKLGKLKPEILKEAQEYRDKLVKQINQSYQDFSQEVTSMFKEQNASLSASQSTAAQIVTDVDTTLQSLQQSETKKQDDQKRFLQLQDSAEKISLCEDKIKLLDLRCVDIKYTFNMNIQPCVVTNSQLGELSVQTSTFQRGTKFPSIHYPYKRLRQDSDQTTPVSSGAVGGRTLLPVKLTRLDKINVKIADDTQDCIISGLDITVDGNMLLADNCNRKVKLFSPDGQLLSSLTLPATPQDVTVINKSEAAVSMLKKQIGIIGIADSGQLSLKRIIKTEYYVSGITVYNNKLIITCNTSPIWSSDSGSVKMIDMTGKSMWTATTDDAGNNLFDRAWFLTTRSGEDGDTVIVTDGEKHTITVLDARSGKVVKVCDVKGKEPLGVTVDGNGNVYVCYNKSGEIVLWSRDMKEEKCLDSLKSPLSMAYNSRRLELLVTSTTRDINYSNFIHRYKISKI